MVEFTRRTINLPDGLAEAAKAKARAEGTTFTSLVEEGLRVVLEREDMGTTAAEPLPAYGDAEGAILVDLTDRDAVWEALDADGPR